jgi:mono/diheme cytochrome c family protein
MKRTVAILTVSGFCFSVAYATLGAQATRSVNEGVYTADQAKRGEATYKEQCSACHGDNLEGSGPMPPLAGKDFLANWQGKTLGDLFEKTQTTMPATAPGSLTPEQAVDVVSYLLSKDNYPAGSAALEGKMEPLQKIKLDAPKQ